MTDDTGTLIGGTICHDLVPATRIDHEDKLLSRQERDELWKVFVEIGHCWRNLPDDSASVKSSWLEFIGAKTENEPSYTGEYTNAVSVVQELVGMYGREEAFRRLFLENGIPDGPPTTRLAHAKRYVVDEFIRVQVVAGGFKGFIAPGSLNYKGYVGGSRYNRTPRVRDFEPTTEGRDGEGE